MLKLRSLLLLNFVLLVGVAVFAGCSGQNPSESGGTSEALDDWKVGLDADVATALSELTDTDRTAALTQKVCPVTDKPLGSMGKPPKVTVEGQDVFLCCTGCEEEIKSKPDQYLSKLEDTK